jgi:hypothetical protein
MTDAARWYEASEDQFDAVPVATGVLVRMSENVAVTLAHRVDLLIRFLEDGALEPVRSGILRRAVRPADVLLRMFPDAYPDRAESDAFRARHEAALRDSTAARRVKAHLIGDRSSVLSTADVDDWLATFGLARFLTMRRRGPHSDTPTLSWLNHVQQRLILAVDPQFRLPA